MLPLEQRRNTMDSTALALPLDAGSVDALTAFAKEALQNRRPEFVASRERLGVSLEQLWVQRSPEGSTTAVLYWEAAHRPGLDPVRRLRRPLRRLVQGERRPTAPR